HADFRGLRPATDRGTPLQHQNLVAALGQVRRANQAVVPRPRKHKIKTVARRRWPRHGTKRSQCQRRKRRALYKSAPANFAHWLSFAARPNSYFSCALSCPMALRLVDILFDSSGPRPVPFPSEALLSAEGRASARPQEIDSQNRL